MQYLLIFINIFILIGIAASAINVESYRFGLLRKVLLGLFLFNLYIYFAPTNINHFDFIDSNISVNTNGDISLTGRYIMTEKDSEALSTYLNDYVMTKSYADEYYGANWLNFEIYTSTRRHYYLSLNTDNCNVRFRKFSNTETYVFRASPEFRDYVNSLNKKYSNIVEVEDDLQFKYKIVDDQLIGQFSLDKNVKLLQILLAQTYKNGEGSGSVSYKKSGETISFERPLSRNREPISMQIIIRYALDNEVFQKTVEIELD
jgi:hypothetical protein